MYNHIPKHILHHSVIQHHLIKHGLSNGDVLLKDNWYFDIRLNKICLEDFKTGVK